MTKSAHGRKYATGHLDQDDRLVHVSKGVYASGAVLENEFTVNYSYDSMGRMLRRDNGTEVTTFVWDGWDLLSETTDSVTTTYLVPDGLVWSFVRGEDVFQVHTDALGSVRVVTDSDGDVVARFEFDAWGELLPGSFDSVGLALRFIGGYGVRTDLETGLLYMRHRWYDASLQRFISRDPIGLEGGSNLYSYAEGMPQSVADEMGLKPPLPAPVLPTRPQPFPRLPSTPLPGRQPIPRPQPGPGPGPRGLHPVLLFAWITWWVYDSPNYPKRDFPEPAPGPSPRPDCPEKPKRQKKKWLIQNGVRRAVSKREVLILQHRPWQIETIRAIDWSNGPSPMDIPLGDLHSPKSNIPIDQRYTNPFRGWLNGDIIPPIEVEQVPIDYPATPLGDVKVD